MKATEKIAAQITATEEKLAKLKADLKASQRVEADAEQRAVFAKLKSSGLSLADVEAFLASRASDHDAHVQAYHKNRGE